MTPEKNKSGDWEVSELTEEDFEEHKQAIQDAESVLAKYSDFLKPSDDESPPPGPASAS